jgi:hypothetical protein
MPKAADSVTEIGKITFYKGGKIMFSRFFCKWVSLSALTFMVLFLLFFITGCVTLPPPDPNNPVAKVAVLPMANETADMDGCTFVRVAFNQIVPSRYYEAIPLDQTDQLLREKMGITLGGQLDFTNPGIGAPSPQEVAKQLGVDGLFYGTVMDFQHLITGFYNKKKVKVKFKLINAKNGDVMWEKEDEVYNQEFNLSLSGAIQAVAHKAVEGAVNTALRVNPLQAETNQVVYKLRATIPSGPVAPRQ